MATKTFKIGLSNTDKQNMAQDVYERVLALTFDEYNSSNTYNTGDFVVYNDTLYQCIADNVTGTWDSTKWQQATMQDLLDDVEGAVASVNDKANVDGNYPTMTVGVADQLSPYDDESGDDQDEPFSFQATGTANGTQPDFATGAIALLKEKRGNTVCVNQFVNPVSSQSQNNVTLTNNGDGSYTINGTASATCYFQIGAQFSVPNGHKCLFIGFSDLDAVWYIASPYTYGTGDKIVTLTGDVSSQYLQLQVGSGKSYSNVKFTPKLIDLTQWFNGDIPDDLTASNFLNYYQGSLAYNTGTLVSANSQYIKCIGRNNFNKETVTTGKYIGSDGSVQTYSTLCYSDYIRVVPSAVYHIKETGASAVSSVVLAYDSNKNFIGPLSSYNGNSNLRQIPSNAAFIIVNTLTAKVDDQVVSIYYAGESGYNDYYPYEVLTNNDTGTEQLLSAGDIADSKTPDGTITRRVGSVDLGSLEWGKEEGVNYVRYYSSLPLAKQGTRITQLVCSTFIAICNGETFNNSWDRVIYITAPHNLYVQYVSNSQTADEFKTAISGVYLYYELTTETTETGTPYSENLVIDDFGTMEFSGTSGVPQGNLIFYPVDYKAFIDTLYDYTEGTPSNLVLQSDLSASETARDSVDTQLQNAIGGTLRQCLCVKETLDFDDTNFVDLGTLDYVAQGSGRFISSGLVSTIKPVSDNADAGNILCSEYLTVSYYNISTDMSICVHTSGNIYIQDNSKSSMSASDFKVAMKGVLLAYEKA